MKWVNHHDWPETSQEASALQKERAGQIDLAGNTSEPASVAAVEAAYGYGGRTLYAAALVLTFPGFEEVERNLFHISTRFPYIPGLFYFREGPALVGALSGLQTDPDLILISGHGIAHPQRCGMACHIGIDFDRPSIGCARRLLHGSYRPVDTAKGSFQPIRDANTEIGLAYRSKNNVKPIFISPGHKCDQRFSQEIIIRCLRGFRLPEPLRVAHLLANKHKRLMERNIRKDNRQAPNNSDHDRKTPQ